MTDLIHRVTGYRRVAKEPPDWFTAKPPASEGFLAVLILCALVATGGVAVALVFNAQVVPFDTQVVLFDACGECDFCR